MNPVRKAGAALAVAALAITLSACGGSDDSSNGDNNINQQQVTVDAHEMQGVTRWENNNSRADLVIEDVRINDNQIECSTPSS